MRFFGNLEVREVAHVLGVSKRSQRGLPLVRDWSRRDSPKGRGHEFAGLRAHQVDRRGGV